MGVMPEDESVINAPSLESVKLVLLAADQCPRLNGESSRALDKAIAEVSRFFHHINLEGASAKPQASATDGGSSSVQSQPAGRST